MISAPLRRASAASATAALALVAALLVPTPASAAPVDTAVTFGDSAAAVQTWTVPDGVTTIYVSLEGAQGGQANNRGAGAHLTGALPVTPGETLSVLVGQQGQNGVANVRGGGGGGGTFLYRTPDAAGVLAAAGGGGGAGSNRGGLSASTTTSGVEGGNGGGAGGTGGSGGTEGPSAGGGGGGGLLSGGIEGNRGGASLADGAAGGPGSTVRFVGTRGTGGFGGGGGTGSTGGGGGGGYSGGGGGRFADGNGGGGGGGGSYFSGSLTGAVSDNLGRGSLTIFTSSFLSAVAPSRAPVGATVEIDGSGLAGASVTIGGVAATVTSSNDTRLLVEVPAFDPVPTGAQTVEVATAGGVTLPAVGAITVAPAPVLTAIEPSTVPRGSGATVTITGTDLDGVTAVTFGGVAAADVTVVSGTTVTATVPRSLGAGAADTVVEVSGARSAIVAAGELTVQAYPAMALSPESLPGGQVGAAYSARVAAEGGTAPYAYSIAAGALPAGIALDAGTGDLTGTPSAAGDVTFTLRATDLYGNSVDSVSVIEVLAAAPIVTGVSPATGTTLGGAVVTITGTGFTEATAVRFGALAARSFTVESDTRITAVTPASPAGEVDVTVVTSGGTSAANPRARHAFAAPVTAPVATPSLPATGADPGVLPALALGLIIAGLLVLTADRSGTRRRVTL